MRAMIDARYQSDRRLMWVVSIMLIAFVLVLIAPRSASAAEGYFWRTLDTVPTRGWADITTSADGSRVIAVERNSFGGTGAIHRSTDGGNTWTEDTSLPLNWRSVSMSRDGMTVAAAACGGNIYTSADGGETWTARDSVRNWGAVAVSNDGTTMAASVVNNCNVNGGNQPLFLSTDSGATWAVASVTGAYGTYIAPNNTTLVAGDASGTPAKSPRYSTDGGATWNNSIGSYDRGWNDFAGSGDGQTIIGVTGSFGGAASVVRSTDGGVTFNEVLLVGPTITTQGHEVAMSDDGQVILTLVGNMSTDSGATFGVLPDYPYEATRALLVSMKSDGRRVYAAPRATSASLAAGQLSVLSYVRYPGAPSSLTVNQSGGTAELNWTAPSYTGGVADYDRPAITDYVVEYSTDGGTTWQVYDDGVSADATTNLAGLDASLTYELRVSAVNVAGQGAPVYVTVTDPNNGGEEAPTVSVPGAPDAGVGVGTPVWFYGAIIFSIVVMALAVLHRQDADKLS